MMFRVKFTSKKDGIYWVSLSADSINQAIKLAERQTRKGFQLALVKEYDNGCN